MRDRIYKSTETLHHSAHINTQQDKLDWLEQQKFSIRGSSFEYRFKLPAEHFDRWSLNKRILQLNIVGVKAFLFRRGWSKSDEWKVSISGCRGGRSLIWENWAYTCFERCAICSYSLTVALRIKKKHTFRIKNSFIQDWILLSCL